MQGLILFIDQYVTEEWDLFSPYQSDRELAIKIWRMFNPLVWVDK